MSVVNLQKPSRVARKIAKVADRRKLVQDERDHKLEAKRRDGFRCRFPECGCGRLKLRLESAHYVHKQAGGDPSGVRSDENNLVSLCIARHQFNAISLHKHTLRPQFLTTHGYDGIIAWEIDTTVLSGAKVGPPHWVEIARESAIQQWEPFTAWQAAVLDRLGEMNL